MALAPHLMRMKGLSVGLIALAISGCATSPAGPRQPYATYLPNGNLSTAGYDADRQHSLIEAEREARRYCWYYDNQKKAVILNESTVYQGKFDEQLNDTAKIAGKVGEIFGEPTVNKAGRVLSSSTDYKTTIEFQCK